MVFIVIISMMARKKFLKRKLKTNHQYEAQENICDDHPDSVELDDQSSQEGATLKTELMNFDDDVSTIGYP